jgi:stress response protein YsnF
VSVVAARAPATQESADRPAAAEDAASAGLFQPRLIEFGETREETTVSVRPVVREELVVGRSEERRVERIEETVLRTEVEVEALPARRGPDDPALERGS